MDTYSVRIFYLQCDMIYDCRKQKINWLQERVNVLNAVHKQILCEQKTINLIKMSNILEVMCIIIKGGNVSL